MRQIEIENEIKRLIEEDINNPEIYNRIRDLAFVFLRRNKLMLTEQEAEEVSYIVAEELYLKVYNGGHIESWIGYINRAYHAYIRVWRKMNSSELIDISDNYELENAIVSMSASMGSSDQYIMADDRLYLESLPKLVELTLDNSKFDKYSSSYLNARISLLMSLCYNKFLSYNLNEEDTMYTRMIYSHIKGLISKTLRKTVPRGSDIYSLLQLFNISSIDSNT